MEVSLDGTILRLSEVAFVVEVTVECAVEGSVAQVCVMEGSVVEVFDVEVSVVEVSLDGTI